MIKPKLITEKERYKRISKLSANQRFIFSVLFKRSKQGLWTRYEHIMDATNPEKRISEMMKMNVLAIKKRNVTGINVAGYTCTFSEYCL